MEEDKVPDAVLIKKINATPSSLHEPRRRLSPGFWKPAACVHSLNAACEMLTLANQYREWKFIMQIDEIPANCLL